MHALIAACLLVPILWHCGPPRRSASVPVLNPTVPLASRSYFCPDEYLKWSLRWKRLEAASTEMVTGQPGAIDERAAIIVYSVTRSSELAAIFREVREELTSQISLASGRALRNSSDTTEDGQNELVEVEFGDKSNSYTTRLHGSVTPRTWTQVEEAEVADLHSFLARMRAWDGEPAAGAYTYVQSGRSHFRVDVAMAGRETIKTFLGEVPTIRFHGHATRLWKDGKRIPQPEPGSFTVWRSDDERYLPLRFEIDTRLGPVRGSLVDYRQPQPGACVLVSSE